MYSSNMAEQQHSTLIALSHPLITSTRQTWRHVPRGGKGDICGHDWQRKPYVACKCSRKSSRKTKATIKNKRYLLKSVLLRAIRATSWPALLVYSPCNRSDVLPAVRVAKRVRDREVVEVVSPGGASQRHRVHPGRC